MKSAILLFIVTIAIVNAQNNVTLDCENLKAKNSIQEYLQIEYLSSIAKDSTVCGTEYQAYGTCCSVSSLKARDTQLRNSLTSASDKLKREFAQFTAAVSTFGQQLQKLVDAADQPDDMRATARKESAKKISDSRAYFFLKTNFQSGKLADFNAALDKCIPDISNTRSSALCILCAARSPYFLAEGDQVVISNDDCTSLAGKCRDALNNLRSFSQGVKLYTTSLNPAVSSALDINLDVSRVDGQGLAALEKFFAGDRLSTGLIGNSAQANGIVCSAALSAGKPTAFEAMADIFNPNAGWDIFNLDVDISKDISKLEDRTEELGELLADGFRTVPDVSGLTNNIQVNAALAAVIARIRALENNRRRRLQSIGTRLDGATYGQYVDEIDTSLYGRVKTDAQRVSSSVVRTGSDFDLGNTYDLYLSSTLSILNAELYSFSTSGQITVPYDNPSATNPAPIVLTNVLQPLRITPVNLKLN